jgi:hypothetical protein
LADPFRARNIISDNITLRSPSRQREMIADDTLSTSDPPPLIFLQAVKE